MPISHTIWSLDTKKPLEATSLNDEKELELLLRDNIEILSKYKNFLFSENVLTTVLFQHPT